MESSDHAPLSLRATKNAIILRGMGKPRGKYKKAEPVRIDPGTPETQARLELPAWSGWPNDLKLAAIAIDRAVRLIAQGGMAPTQDYARVGAASVDSDWPEGGWQEKLYRRYRSWCRAMERRRWSVRLVV